MKLNKLSQFKKTITSKIENILIYWFMHVGGPAFLAHTKQKVSSIVGLTALRLAFFMGYE